MYVKTFTSKKSNENNDLFSKEFNSIISYKIQVRLKRLISV